MAPVDLSNDTKNWLKAVLALKHLKEGLLPFVDQHISTFHNNIIATYGTCNQCTTENVLRCPTKNVCWKRHGICQYHDNGNPLRRSRPCPNGACDRIRDAIVREHFMGDPMWKNTDAAKWSSDAWEVAKCFLPPGSKDAASFADTDCTGILSLCLHCLPLTTLLVHVIQDFEKNRDNRNILMHYGRQEISDTDRASFIQDAIQLLSTYQTPVDQHTRDCITILTEIDSDGLMLTTDDVVGIMEDKVDAIRSKQQELEVELQETKGDIAVTTDTIANQQTTLDSYKSGIKQVDDDLKSIHSILQRLDVQNDELKKDMENIRTNNEVMCKQINDEIEALETKVKTLETDMVTIDSKHDVRHKEHDERHKEHDERHKEYDERHKEHDERHKEYDERHKEHDERHKDHDERHKEYDERHKEYDERHKEHDERHKDHDERHKEYDERHKEYDERHKEHDERHKDHDERHKEHDERHKEYDERHKEHDERHKDHDERHKEYDERHKEHDERHKEYDERHKEHDERHKEHDERHKEYDERHKEHDERHKEHDERHKEHDERHKEHDERHKDHDERHKEHDERHKEHDERHKEYDERHKEHDERHKEHDERHKEHDERHKEYDERHKEHDERHKEHDERHKEYDERHKEHDERHKEHDERHKEYDERHKEYDERHKEHDERHNELERRVDAQFAATDRHEDHVLERSTETEVGIAADIVPTTKTQDARKMQGRKRLRDYLIKMYRKHYIDVPVAPPKQDMWSDIGKHYRDQNLKQVRMPGESQIHNDEDGTIVTVNSYKEVFYRHGTECRNIYIKGDAGSGKSVFCQHMVSIWCDNYSSDKKQASPHEIDTPSDEQNDINIRILYKFDFLFYITLRHATHLNDIVSMIKANLLRNNKELSNQLTEVLEIESDKCLILLDGLDEWSPPKDSAMSPFVTFGLPDRDDSLDWTFLTTTRPWKLETLRPKRCEIDQMIELSGLTHQSVQETINSVVDYLNNRYIKNVALNKNPAQCFWHLNLNAHVVAMTFPIILNHLVCIWFENGDVGKTQCDIYAAIVNLFIRYADLKTSKKTHSDSYTANDGNDLPACLRNREICHNLTQPLFKLSKLAFLTLFCKDRTSSLVFDSRTTHIHDMSNSEVDFWLEIGLLSQDSVDIRSTMDDKLLSFHHKTIQEFLAAVYISMHTETDNDVLPTVKDICGSVDMILEMSQVFVFLSGMAPAIVTVISRYISQVVSADEDILRYRNTVTVPSDSRPDNLVRAIQQLVDTCISESLDGDLTNIEVYIQDITIYEFSPKLPSNTEWLRFNKSDIRSLCVDAKRSGHCEPNSESIDRTQLTMINKMNFQHLSTLKVVIDHNDEEEDVNAFVVSIIRTCTNTLATILLDGLSLKHSTREAPWRAAGRLRIKEISIKSVCVNRHGQIMQIHPEEMKYKHCPGPCRLDLSQLKRLQRLHLVDVCVDTVEINTSQLEECNICHLPSSSRTSCQPTHAAIVLMFHGIGRLLQILTLKNISLRHDHLDSLMLFVKQAIGLREVTLSAIKCIDCSIGCACRLDISRLTQLEKLELHELRANEVHINTTELSVCTIDSLSSSASITFGEIPFTFHGDCKMLGLVTLTNIAMKHKVLEELMMLMTQATGVRKITLKQIKCIDCVRTGCTCRIDLSWHSQLEELEVQELYVSEVHINTTELNRCIIDSSRLSSSMPNEPVTGEMSLMFHGEGKKLKLLTLTNIVLKHTELEQLMLFMAQATGLREITLDKIKCSDCCTHRLDLSRHTRLEKLTLQELHVSDVQINTTELNTCTIDRLRQSNCTPNEQGSGTIPPMFHGDSKTLGALIISDIVLKHEQLEQLMVLMAHATELQHIALNEIKCSDNCTGYAHRLDLSQHTKILSLILQKLHVSEVHINTKLLIICIIHGLKPSSCTPDEPGSGEIKLKFHGHDSMLSQFTLTNIVMKHEHFKQLMLIVSQARMLREIILNEIKCSDCCSGCASWLHLSLPTITTVGSMFSTGSDVSRIQINSTALGKLQLKSIDLKHEQLEHLMVFVTQATELQEITLSKIKCSDCSTHCTSRLDLSQHRDLCELELQELDVSEVQINTTYLNLCTIDRLILSSYTPNEPGSGKNPLLFHGSGKTLGDLTLTNIVLKHEQLEQLMVLLAQATELQHITLNEIKCSDNCTAYAHRLDLSKHTKMLTVNLQGLHVSEVHINTQLLIRCAIGRLKPSNCTPDEPRSGEIQLMFHGHGRNLRYLSLTNIVMKHEQLEQLLMLFVPQTTGLQWMTLRDITCSDCRSPCAYRLDLTHHNQLIELELTYVNLSEVGINNTNLKMYTVEGCTTLYPTTTH